MTSRTHPLTSALLVAATLAFALAAPSTTTAADAADPRPNIVLIISDDHGWPYYGFMGSTTVQTPHLDRLADSGTVFTETYNTSSRCRPSLRSILTGLHPHQFALRAGALARENRKRTGSRGQPIERMKTLPRLLSQAGYATFQAGKLWDGTHTQAGFTEGLTPTRAGATQAHPGAADLGRKTLDPVFSFLRAKRDAPFFLWFAPQLPHVPHDAPKKFRTPYKDAGWKGQALDYFASCTWSDEIIGQLLTFLDENDLRENTLVVYLSDNGWQHVDKGFPASGGAYGKGSMHELGVRTPMIFRWPDHIPAGRDVDTPASTVDLFPTLLDIGGVTTIPRDRSGTDLTATLLGGPAPAREDLVGGQFLHPDERRPKALRAFTGDAYFVVDGSWYYILYGGSLDAGRLFDRTTNPVTPTDVSKEHPERLAQYRERVLRWLDETHVGRHRLGWVPAVDAPYRKPRGARQKAQ